MATTAVIRIQKLNFQDKIYADGKTIKGGTAGLWAMKHHNERHAIDNMYECKSKRGTHISKERSEDNIYVKHMSTEDIEEIKEQGKSARPNASCAFEIVVDF